MSQAQQRHDQLTVLKAQRKQGEIDTLTYYKGLITILAHTVQNLSDESISESDAKKQIPLILVFLEEQISKLSDRGG